MKLAILTFLGVLYVIVAFSGVGFAQGKEITREEYWKNFRDALAKSRTHSRRNAQKVKSTWEGKLNEEDWTYEYQVPNRIRYVHVTTLHGESTRTEQIDIGGIKYCKRGETNWIVTKSSCIGGSGSGGPSNILKEVSHREKTRLHGRPAILYQQYVTYMNVQSKTADSDGPSYWESKFWIDEEGLILRAESRRGLTKNSAPIYEMVETYTYDQSIRIEAPIK